MKQADFAILLAPGAGASTQHPRMKEFHAMLRPLGRVVPFDFPYMRAGKTRPDRLPQLIAAQIAAIDHLAATRKGPVVLVGKSMGGRVGCHVSLERSVAGLVCLGYPLCGAGDPAKLRDQVLIELRTPILFIQGTRDKLCPLELLDKVRQRMTARSELLIVEGGDHSLLVSKTELKRQSATQADVDGKIQEAIARFIASLEPRPS